MGRPIWDTTWNASVGATDVDIIERALDWFLIHVWDDLDEPARRYHAAAVQALRRLEAQLVNMAWELAQAQNFRNEVPDEDRL